MNAHQYTTVAAQAIWSEQAKLDRWARVEVEVARASGASAELLDELENTPVPTPQQVEEAERITHHDLMAFLTVWRSQMSPEASAAVHRGLTSSDVVDTALALAVVSSGAQVGKHLLVLLRKLAAHVAVYSDAVKVGRTHGQWAEPTTWGAEVAGYVIAGARAYWRLQSANAACRRVKLSGPVGTYSHLGPAVEAAVAETFGFVPAVGSTQVWGRDAIAEWAHALAQVATWVESLALQVRLGAQSDVGELAEHFTLGQTGSSAMPHKRNPVRSERLCGLARLARAHAATCLENVALWGQRDISHSSVERQVLPELTALVDFALAELSDVFGTLHVDRDAMAANLRRAGYAPYSSVAYLRLRDQGVSEPEAYAQARNPDTVATVVPDRDPGLFFDSLDRVFNRMWEELP